MPTKKTETKSVPEATKTETAKPPLTLSQEYNEAQKTLPLLASYVARLETENRKISTSLEVIIDMYNKK